LKFEEHEYKLLGKKIFYPQKIPWDIILQYFVCYDAKYQETSMSLYLSIYILKVIYITLYARFTLPLAANIRILIVVFIFNFHIVNLNLRLKLFYQIDGEKLAFI
jgi:hypothetical protein